MQYLSDNSYLAIIPETTEGTALKPTNFVPLVSESIKTVLNHSADRRIKGLSWKSNDLVRGNRSHEGDVVVLGDPDTLGHFLNMILTKGTTSGDSLVGYTHPLTVGNGKSYTFEVKKGMYAQRFFGVRVDELNIDFPDGQMQLSASIKAQGQVGVMSLGVALSGGAVTALTLDDTYDIDPSRGLVAGDVIVVGGTELTISTVSGTTVNFTSASPTAAVGDPIYLKAQTVTQPTLQDPFYLGNLLVGTGVDETAATTASATRANATKLYDLTISIKSNLFTQNGTNRIDPVQIIPRTREAQITLKQLFENVNQRQKYLDRSKQAITINALGKFIKADFTTQENLTLKFYNVKLIENDNVLEVGEYIRDEQNFEALYDDSDATASLVNRTAGTAY